jgi:hypothetical protein
LTACLFRCSGTRVLAPCAALPDQCADHRGPHRQHWGVRYAVPDGTCHDGIEGPKAQVHSMVHLCHLTYNLRDSCSGFRPSGDCLLPGMPQSTRHESMRPSTWARIRDTCGCHVSVEMLNALQVSCRVIGSFLILTPATKAVVCRGPRIRATPCIIDSS